MSMTRYPNLQENIPVFVRTQKSIICSGKNYHQDKEFPWLALGFPVEKVRVLYDDGQLYHSEELENEHMVGDGLDAMSEDQLHTLVSSLNVKVKAKTQNDSQYQSKKCKLSQIKSKQIGLVRSWRRNFGHFED